jgi:hypothetical protein
VIANAVKCLRAEVERRQRNVSSPHGVVVATIYIRREGIFAGMPAWSVATVVAKCDGFGEGDIETERARD